MTTARFSCRACNSGNHEVLLDMGQLPLANDFVTDPDSAKDQFRQQLTLVMCRDCSLLQLRELVPGERLFGSYLWVSSTSATIKGYGKWFTERLVARYQAKTKPLLVEIGSNDGFMLERYRDAGFNALGVDPSNLAEEASQRGLRSIHAFFGRRVADQILGTDGAADVIVARNVLGHVNELQDFVDGVKALLSPSGHFVLEAPYAFLLRDELQYDTIFHEHVSYLTFSGLSNLMKRYGLKITDISFVRMNGGSLLCEIVHESSPKPRNDQAFLDFESLIGLDQPEGWRRFTERVHAQREAFVGLLRKLAGEGKKVVGHGAAAKCMTMLNYCNIGTELLSAMGDANPRKQGLLCPGVHIPVVSPEQLTTMKPDYIMIGAWNFKEEIIRQFRDLGYRGSFIVPLPTPTIIS